MSTFHVYEHGEGRIDAAERRYGWLLLDDDGQPLAESAREFRSPDACARDAARFRILAAAATIGAGRHRAGAHPGADRAPQRLLRGGTAGYPAWFPVPDRGLPTWYWLGRRTGTGPDN